MKDLKGHIEADLFAEEVDSLEHPEVIRFKRLLEEVAAEHNCKLISFDIDCGTVIFSFDNDELTADILKIFQNDIQS